MDLFSDSLTWRDPDVMLAEMQHYPSISLDGNRSSYQDLDRTVLTCGDLNSIYQTTTDHYNRGLGGYDRLLSTNYNPENDEGRVGRTSPSVIANTLVDIDHGQLFHDYHVPSHVSTAQEDVSTLASLLGNRGAQITDQVDNRHDQCGEFLYDPAFEAPHAMLFGSSFGPVDLLLSADGSPVKTAIQTHPLYPYLVSAHMDCYKIGAEPVDLKNMEAQLKHQHLQHQNNFRPSPETEQELDNVLAWYLKMLVDLKEKMEEPFFTEKEWCSEIFDKLKLMGPSSSPSEMAGWDVQGQTSSGDKQGCTSMIGETRQQSNTPPFDHKSSLIMEHMKQGMVVKEWLRSKHDRSQICNLRGQCRKKRRQGKHPQTARERLVEWFNGHGDWPYPSEEEKLKLAEITNLEARQINNWFINQRKRHWDSPSKEETNLQVQHELNSNGQNVNGEKDEIDTFYVPLDMFPPSQNARYS